MKISVQAMAVGTFVPMLESLAAIFDKSSVYTDSANADLVNARLAPDMYTLAQQVQLACHHARDATTRLAGGPVAAMEEPEKNFSGLTAQIARTLNYLRGVPAAAFDGAEERDCSIEISNDMVIEMNGVRFLKAWSLPHFYFHIVTAYDILRHRGVQIGKMDYLSQVGGFIRAKHA